jgi:hypothetical protein
VIKIEILFEKTQSLLTAILFEFGEVVLKEALVIRYKYDSCSSFNLINFKRLVNLSHLINCRGDNFLLSDYFFIGCYISLDKWIILRANILF